MNNNKNDRNSRTYARRVAITIPQSGSETPYEICSKIITKYKQEVERVGFVQEQGDSEDEHIHLHGIVIWKTKKSVPFTEWDQVLNINGTARHNSYEPVKNLSKYIAYILKEQRDGRNLEPYCFCYPRVDNDRSIVLQHFDPYSWETHSTQKQPQCDLIVQYIIDNDYKVLNKELYEAFGFYQVEHNRKHWEAVIRNLKSKWDNPTSLWSPLFLTANPIQNRLYEVINSVVPKLLQGRSLKVKNNCVAIISPSNYRKTGLLKHIGKTLVVLKIDFNQNFPLGSISLTQRIDILFLDSWMGCDFSYSTLERLLDADEGQQFNIKNNTFYFSKRPLVIIASNTKLKDWYTFGEGQTGIHGESLKKKSTISEEQREALYARLNVFNLTEPLTGFPDPEEDAYALPLLLLHREKPDKEYYY